LADDTLSTACQHKSTTIHPKGKQARDLTSVHITTGVENQQPPRQQTTVLSEAKNREESIGNRATSQVRKYDQGIYTHQTLKRTL
jgi:hypothetical protein